MLVVKTIRSKSKQTTLQSIADSLGISVATVSRVLSGSEYPVKLETRKKIISLANELNYKSAYNPNSPDPTFRDIGLVIPTLTNPFYNELIMGIESECESRNYFPIICSSKRNSKREYQNVKLLLSKNVKGLIISSLLEEPSYFSDIVSQGTHLVYFDQSTVNEKLSYVKFNYFEAGRLATEYLLLHGHRNICFASPPINREIRREIFLGYKQALLSFHVDYDQRNVLMSKLEKESSTEMFDYTNGIEMAKQFLNLPSRPTAIFTINDSTAYGIMKHFSDVGIRVPEDVSIIGCDDLSTSEIVSTPLTTIHQPGYETGKLTCQILLNEIDGATDGPSHIVLHPSVTERKSVKSL